MTETDDRALVAAFLRCRDEETFLRLYHRHTETLFRFASRLSGGPGPEPADVVQEAWVRAIERLDGFRWDSSLRTWLCGIVLNRWREVRRRESHRDELSRGLSLVDVRPAPAHDPEIASRLEAALQRLPASHREVLVLHEIEGFTHAEIAQHFGVAEGTSKSHLHRARRALRDILNAERERTHG